MPNTPFRIAFAALARPTFDMPLAQDATQQALDQLRQAGFEVLTPDNLIADLVGVQAFLSKLDAAKNSGFDLLLIFQATFADSTLVTSLVDGLVFHFLTTTGFPLGSTGTTHWRQATT